MNVITKESGKFEQVYITGGDAVIYYANSLTTARPKPKSEDKNYSCTLFVDSDTRDKLEFPVEEGGVFVNKQLFEVGKDKNKKRKVKYPTSDQAGEDERSYDEVKGLHGISLTAPEFKKNGDSAKPKIVDDKGNPWDTNAKPIGNGTKVNVRMWGWRNEEGQLNVTLDLVQITDYVEGSSGGNSGFDDVLGIDLGAVEAKEVPQGMDNPDDFDDDIPF